MTQAFLLTNTRLDDLHYNSLTTMGVDRLLKLPVTLRMPWRKIDAGPLNEEDAKALTTWLTEIGQADDFLVIEGPNDAIEPILQEARALSLIAMRPVWTPAPAFIPLIGDDPE